MLNSKVHFHVNYEKRALLLENKDDLDWVKGWEC